MFFTGGGGGGGRGGSGYFRNFFARKVVALSHTRMD